MDLARKILDELMGPERNKMPNEKGSFGVKFSDPDVCQYSLLGFCPYEAFMNTKSDIGPCPFRYHEESLKEQFEEKGESYREQYERNLLQLLEGLINDAERKMRRGRERLEVRPNDPSVTHAMGTSDETEEQRVLLELQIKEIVAQIEACAEMGQFKEVAELSEKVDALKSQMNSLKVTIDYDNPLHRLEKRMEVCLTCGALLVVNDAPKRVDAHFEGRQHLSWVKLRDTVEILRQKCGNSRLRDSNRGRDSRSYDRDNYSSRSYEPRDSRDSRSYEPRDGRDGRSYEPRDSRDRDSRSHESRSYESRDSRSVRDSRDSRDLRDSRGSRDGRDSRHHRESRDSRDSREHRDSRDSRSSGDSYRRDSRRFSDDRGSSRDAAVELDYELGEIPEDGEIAPQPSRRSRSRSRSRSRERNYR